MHREHREPHAPHLADVPVRILASDRLQQADTLRQGERLTSSVRAACQTRKSPKSCHSQRTAHTLERNANHSIATLCVLLQLALEGIASWHSAVAVHDEDDIPSFLELGINGLLDDGDVGVWVVQRLGSPD